MSYGIPCSNIEEVKRVPELPPSGQYKGTWSLKTVTFWVNDRMFEAESAEMLQDLGDCECVVTVSDEIVTVQLLRKRSEP